MAQFTFNLSLHMTSVTSNTILSSTSSLFTYGLSCSFSLERLAFRKLVFISLCIAGATMQCLSASPASRQLMLLDLT